MTQPDATPRVISGSDQAANEAVPPAQRSPSAGQPPPPVSSQPPAQEPAGEDLEAQALKLQEQLAEVQAKARAAGGDTVRVKVEGVHSGMIHNGIYVGTDWTEVPVSALPAMTEGAANAGVTLTQEETES